MRIAYCCADPGVPVFGTKGCSSHVQSVLAALLRRGARVELFAARTGGEATRRLDGVRVHELSRRRGGSLAEQEQAAQALARELRAALDREGPFDVVVERHTLWSAAGMEHARDTGVPGVLEVNAPLLEEQAAYRGLIDREAAEDAAERAFAAARVLIAVSDRVAAYLRARAPAGDVRVVPNGVDPTLFSGPPPRGDGGPFTVAFVGGLRPWHGLETLVAAFAALHERRPRSRLLVVGDGPGREALERDLRARGLRDAATLTGALPCEEVPRRLAAADACVAPYDDLPGFWFSPLKLFEYMAAGLPTVAARVGQVAEVLEDGRTGLLVAPGDGRALADALLRLEGDPALRTSLGRRARAVALRDHTWDAVVERMLRPVTRTEVAA